MVICLERGADLHMAQLMPLPLTVSCFSKIEIGFAFLVPAHPGSPGKRAVKRVCVLVTFLLFETSGFASESNIEVGFSKFMKPILDAQIKQTVSLKLVLMPVLVLTYHKHC